MNDSRKNEICLIAIQPQIDGGVKVGDVAREHGMTAATIHPGDSTTEIRCLAAVKEEAYRLPKVCIGEPR